MKFKTYAFISLIILILLFSFGCLEKKKIPNTTKKIILINITLVNQSSNNGVINPSNNNGNPSQNTYTKTPVSLDFLYLCNIVSEDVQQPGSSVLISGNGLRILIDTGSTNTYNQFINELHSKGVTHVDYLILTSDTDDRIGGFSKLMTDYPDFADHILYKGDSLNNPNIERMNGSICIRGICISFINSKSQNNIYLTKVAVYGRSIMLGQDLSPQDISRVTGMQLGHADVVEMPEFGTVTYHNSKPLQLYLNSLSPSDLIVAGCPGPTNKRNFLDSYLGSYFSHIPTYKTYLNQTDVSVFVNPDGRFSVDYYGLN